MTQTYQSLPTYDQPLTIKGQTSSVWYRYLSGLFQGVPQSNESAVSVGASPYSYVAPSGGSLNISGGTVSALQLTRQGVYNLTGTGGLYALAKGDTVTITYTGLPPTVTFFPS